MSVPRRLRIGVMGGGVAGMTAAIGLARAGHETAVYERAPAPRRAGGALLLWTNGVRALARLGLSSDVLDAGTIVHATEFRRWNGNLLTTLPMSDFARRLGQPSVLIARTALLDVLLRAAGSVSQFYGKGCDRFEEHAGAVEAHFSDGTSESFDVLIGADGLYSRVRAALLGDEEPRSARQVSWVGIAPLTHDLFHGGVAIGTVGTGRVFWAAGMKDGYTYWYATVGAADCIDSPQALLRHYRGSHEPICELIRDTPREAIVVTAVQDRPPRGPWSRGRVTLVGDAAHPCTPDIGQGACQAIESAAALTEELSRPIASIPAALNAYEQARFARSARVTAISRATAVTSVVDDAGYTRVIDAGLRWGMPFAAPASLEWLLGG